VNSSNPREEGRREERMGKWEWTAKRTDDISAGKRMMIVAGKIHPTNVTRSMSGCVCLSAYLCSSSKSIMRRRVKRRRGRGAAMSPFLFPFFVFLAGVGEEE